MINKVILVGRVGKDIESRTFGTEQKKVVNLSLATDDTYKDKSSGEKKQITEWHNITLYEPISNIAEKYVKSGYLIYLEGKIITKKWKDKEGNDRYSTGIVANVMKMLSKPDNSEKTHQTSNRKEPESFHDDDIPF